MIKIMNLRKEKPAHRYDVIVDRRSVLGNPFYIVHPHTPRDTVCDYYENWLSQRIELRDFEVLKELARLRKLHWSFGKLRLFCWCAPKRCHAETIKRVVMKEMEHESK